jgi:hypothetical protein
MAGVGAATAVATIAGAIADDTVDVAADDTVVVADEAPTGAFAAATTL